MITKIEYIKALILIDEYHRQNYPYKTNTKVNQISDAIQSGELSVRACNVLSKIIKSGLNYFEEIDRNTVLIQRNAGIKVVNEILNYCTVNGIKMKNS